MLYLVHVKYSPNYEAAGKQFELRNCSKWGVLSVLLGGIADKVAQIQFEMAASKMVHSGLFYSFLFITTCRCVILCEFYDLQKNITYRVVTSHDSIESLFSKLEMTQAHLKFFEFIFPIEKHTDSKISQTRVTKIAAHWRFESCKGLKAFKGILRDRK